MQLERRRDLANGRQGRFRAPCRLGFDLPAQAKSDKSQGVRGTESPDSINQTLKKTEKHVSVFSGEVQTPHLGRHSAYWLLTVSNRLTHPIGVRALCCLAD